MDLDRLQQIADTMDQAGLTEIEVSREGFSIYMVKEAAAASAAPASPSQPAGKSAAPAPEKGSSSGGSGGAKLSQRMREEVERQVDEMTGGKTCSFVVSSKVGVFRPAKKRDGSEWKAGDPVKIGDRLGVIEVMKVPHDVISTAEGILSEFLVEDGEGVEYGQPLVTIVPAAGGE